MIFITAVVPVRPEHADDGPQISRGFTEATRVEQGCPGLDRSAVTP